MRLEQIVEPSRPGAFFEGHGQSSTQSRQELQNDCGFGFQGFSKFLGTTSLSAAMFFTSAAQAMEIQQFDKMAQDDRADYVSALIQGAEKVLTDEGRSDMAAKVSHLFTTNAPNGNVSIGMSQFMVTLAVLRVKDAERVAKDPKAQRLEVEDAMALTLQQNGNGIELPDSFFTVASGFKPKHSPAKKNN